MQARTKYELALTIENLNKNVKINITNRMKIKINQLKNAKHCINYGVFSILTKILLGEK